MGVLTIIAECECGFCSEKMAFGCGMMTVDTIDYFPALCITCGELASINLKSEPILCSRCHSDAVAIYNMPKLRGEVAEADVSSERFYRAYELWNETLEMLAENEGTKFVPMSIEQYKKERIERHKDFIANARDPIFSHYNYCPGCKHKKLRFYNKTLVEGD